MKLGLPPQPAFEGSLCAGLSPGTFEQTKVFKKRDQALAATEELWVDIKNSRILRAVRDQNGMALADPGGQGRTVLVVLGGLPGAADLSPLSSLASASS